MSRAESDDALTWDQPCPQCGAAMQRIARRCWQCGADVPGPDEAPLPEQSPAARDAEQLLRALASSPMAFIWLCLFVLVALWVVERHFLWLWLIPFKLGH